MAGTIADLAEAVAVAARHLSSTNPADQSLSCVAVCTILSQAQLEAPLELGDLAQQLVETAAGTEDVTLKACLLSVHEPVHMPDTKLGVTCLNHVTCTPILKSPSCRAMPLLHCQRRLRQVRRQQ